MSAPLQTTRRIARHRRMWVGPPPFSTPRCDHVSCVLAAGAAGPSLGARMMMPLRNTEIHSEQSHGDPLLARLNSLVVVKVGPIHPVRRQESRETAGCKKCTGGERKWWGWEPCRKRRLRGAASAALGLKRTRRSTMRRLMLLVRRNRCRRGRTGRGSGDAACRIAG